MEVRRALPPDSGPIAEVFIASFETLRFLPVLHSHEEHRAFIGDLVERADVWVAEHEGRIVGMAAVSGDVLGQLYVHPRSQRRGAGAALLDEVKRARPHGFSLWVFQENEPARRFYERHGCRLVRLTDGRGNAEAQPDALYEWAP